MILVDTPGIGGSGNVTDKLIEYLPNALLFIFVINAGSAGGMQNDRVNILLLILTLNFEKLQFFAVFVHIFSQMLHVLK